MDKRKPGRGNKVKTDRDSELRIEPSTKRPNPPYTNTGKMSAPKFGSAGSGGAEIEPGPERD